MMQPRRLLGRRHGDGVDVAAEVSLNDRVGVQILAKFHDLSVLDFENVRPLVFDARP